MKIAASALHLDALHQRQESYSQSTSLRAWRDAPTDRAAPSPSTPPATSPARVSLSEAGRKAQADESNTTSAIEDAAQAAENDPRLSLLRALIALLTGKDPLSLSLSDFASATETSADAPASETPTAAPSQANAGAPAVGWGVEFSQSVQYSESESMSFSASGMIRTADGQDIRFDLSLTLNRSFSFSSETSLKLGDAARPKKDPLILNFAGPAAQLTSQRFAFDLDSDGKADQIHFATGGSGFLALDRNGNGRIDNGKELFGAQSGDGFAELVSLDSDANGWIDENDPAYAQLRLLRKDADGQERLSTLHEAQVGAIALSRVSSPFELKTANQASPGEIRSSGLFLGENGTPGVVQQIDLSV